MLNSQETHLIETSYDRLKSEKSHTFQQYREKILLKQEFSDGLQISMNIKDITIPLIIHYYFKHSEHYTNLSTLNHVTSVSSVSTPGRWHNAIRVRAKPCVHRFNYSGHSRKRSSPSGLWT